MDEESAPHWYRFTGWEFVDEYREAARRCEIGLQRGMPVGEKAYTPDEMLRRELKELVLRRRPREEGRGAAPYAEEVRSRVCAINIVMNEIGLTPPRFRPARKVRPTNLVRKALSHGPTEDDYLSNDQKIIDLHWLWMRGKRDEVADADFRDLFSSEEFNFGLAEEFVSKPWTTEKRVGKTILALEIEEQWQLLSLAKKRIQDRWKEIQEEVSECIGPALRAQKNSSWPITEQQVQKYLQTWTAEKIAVEISKDCSNRLVAQVCGWLIGAPPIADKLMHDKRKRMHQRI